MKHFIPRLNTSALFYFAIVLCLTPIFSVQIALFVGILFSVGKIKQPQIDISKITKLLLQASVVMIGFSMSLTQVVQSSKTGFLLTISSVILTMTSGFVLAYFLKVERKTAILISCGTAICGGSAIAAVSPLINAQKNQVSFALAVVFVLNSIALFVFPLAGNYLHLSQETFGYWAAIAIHDTSSVVGAGSAFGAKALEIATTVKLTRALWIIPLSLMLFSFTKVEPGAKIKIPWFIFLFIGAILVRHLIPEWSETFSHLSWFGQRGMAVTLFLIGYSISYSDIKSTGIKPFVMGVMLWAIISFSSLIFLTY